MIIITVGLTNGTGGTTNGTIGTNVSTNGTTGTNGTIGCRETFRVLWLSTVPLATNGNIGKISNGTIGRIPKAHRIALKAKRAFGILQMVPLEILPMVPLVANGTIGNQRTLNVSRQPMLPLVPMNHWWKRWYHWYHW